MSSYADIAREHKRARSLYLELRALGLKVYLEEDDGDPRGPMLVVGNLGVLPSAHRERVKQRVGDNEVGLRRIILDRWDPDLHAIRREGILA